MILIRTYMAAILLTTGFSFMSQVNAAEPTPEQTPPQESGRWITGDMHVHTAMSADSRSTLGEVLHKGIEVFGLDYLAVSNHLRNNSRNNQGNENLSQLLSTSLNDYELPYLNRFQKQHQNKLLISSFEWDVPTHDHMNVGILYPLEEVASKVAVTRYFEYRFSLKNTLYDFTPAYAFSASSGTSKNTSDNLLQQQFSDYEKQGVKRQNVTHEDSITALKWLQENHTTNSYAMLNHPTRYTPSYSIAEIREMNDAAPDVFFLVEGMVGNQFNGERGDYNQQSLAGLLGGVDPVVAELGGYWDALLAEGRHIWNVANSDHHFKAIRPYSSGYFPGEYSKTYLYLEHSEGDKSQAPDNKEWLDALKSGNSFSVFGDLINALNFTLKSADAKATMGQTLKVNKQQKVTVTIGFKQPPHNNREQLVGDEEYNGKVPELHHIDLIAGDLVDKAKPGTEEYGKKTNPTTRVLHSFTAGEWQLDSQGFYTMSFTFTARKDQYFRLRGTNLGYNQPGLTRQGEPLRSPIIELEGGNVDEYYQRINNRNYNDLWFYSNPVFVEVKDEE